MQPLCIRNCACLLLLLPVLATGCERNEAKMPPPKAPAVEVSYPLVLEVTDYEDVTGRTEAIPMVDVRPHVTGYLTAAFFKDGQVVEKGATLFEIDSRTYRADRDKAKANLLQMQARVRRLEADYDRAAPLRRRGNITAEEFDKIVGDLEEARAGVKSSDAALERTEVDLAYTKIIAEFTGRASRRNVDPGNLVKADDTILTTIVGMDPMYVYFDVDERTLLRFQGLIREGKVDDPRLKAMNVSLGLADEHGFPHAGKIDFVDNKLDVSTGTLRLRGEFANPEPHVLVPGLFVRVRIQVGKKHQAVLIAERALGTDQGQKFLYVVNDKNVAEYRSVTVGSVHEIPHYKLTDTVLAALKVDQVPPPVLAKLRGLKDKDFESRQGFIKQVQRVAGADEVQPHQERIVIRATRLYPFREVAEGLSSDEKVVVSGLQRVRPGNPVDPKVVDMPLPGAEVPHK